MRFFLDNNLAPVFAQVLQILSAKEGHEVHHLTARFPRDVKDVEWITALGQEGDWVIVSGDMRIFRNRPERAAWLEAGLVAFFLGKGWTTLPLWEQAWRLVRWWPLIVEQAEKVRAPAGFIIPVKGAKFEVVTT